MKIKLQSILILMLTLTLLFSGVYLPQTAWAVDEKTPEELEVTWRIRANADRAWSDQNVREDGKVSARYNVNDSFTLNLSGSTVLTNTRPSWYNRPYFQSITDNDYSRSCTGGGTSTTWYLNKLEKWSPEKGWVKKDFESTTVGNWQYHWPGKEHEGADDTPISWLEIIPPESDNEPPRYRISFEPFFFIDYDTADDYFETTGTYQIQWSNWEGSHSESGELGDHAGSNAPSLANHAWHDRVEVSPDGSCAVGDLTYSGGTYRGQGTVQHTFHDEDGQSSIEITYEINRKPGMKEIQPIQVLGRYEYRDKNDYDPATDFVAGKDTVIQVILPDDIKAADQSNAQVKIYREGIKITTLSNFKKDTKHNALIFIPSSRSSCGNWQAGTYKFVATLGDSEELTLDNILFREQRPLKVLAVPVKANYAGTIETAGNQWKSGGTFMRRVYPVAYDDFTYKLGSLFDASDASYDITTSAGQFKLWKALNKLQNNGSYDQIIGFIEKGILLPNGSVLQGYTYGPPSNIVVNSDQDMQATVAHEVAHIYEIGDEYQGGAYNLSVNSPPLGYRGTDWDDSSRTVTASDPKVKPYPGAQGALISEKLNPYDTGGRGLLGDSICFMGSGAAQSKNWISPSVWKHLFKTLAAPATTASISPNRVLQNATGGTRVVEASGLVSRTGDVEISLPWSSYNTTQPVVNQTGTYTIQAINAEGTVLASNGFTPTFFIRSNPPREIDLAPFKQVVPFPEGTHKFLIVDQNNTILTEYTVTANAPTVEITAPTAGQNLTSTNTITWNAEDADGDNLSYKVEYTPDGSNWELLAFDLKDNKWVQDFNQLPGGDKAQIRVTASDGVNSSIPATSAIFRVPLKGLEVFIEAPASESSFSTAEGGVVLQGSAYDPQEGQIYDDNRLIWTSDQVGELGRGPTVFTNVLGAGKHVITLTATNSSGQSSYQSITVNISSEPMVEPDNYTELPAKTFTDRSKRTVIFNKAVNTATLQNQIRIVDTNSNPVDIIIVPGDDGVSALIYPSSGTFPAGDYTIYIEKEIESLDDQPLKCAYKMNFYQN